MRRHGWNWLVGLAVLGLAAVGCDEQDSGDAVAPGSSSMAELAPIGDPGADASPFPIDRGTVTAAGTDLVVISSSWPPGQEIEAALRREDGSWWKLPPLPFTGFIHRWPGASPAAMAAVRRVSSRSRC